MKSLKSFKKILLGSQMSKEPKNMTLAELIKTWFVLKRLEGSLKERLEMLRKELLSIAETKGVQNEKGGYVFHTCIPEDVKIISERRVQKLPDEAALRQILTARGLTFDEAFTAVTKVVPDASKIQNLVALGKLPAQEVEKAKKSTRALRAKESAELSEQLDAVFSVSVEE